MQTKRIARRVLAIVLSLLMIVPSMLTFAAENTNGITYEYIVKQNDPSAAEFTVELYAKAETETKLNALAFGIEWHTALFGYKSISYNPELSTAASGSGAGIELIDSYNPDNGKLGGTVYPFLDGTKYYFTVPTGGLPIATITFTLGSAEYYNYYSVDGDKLNAISGANKVVAHDSGDDNGLSVDPADITEISFKWVKNIASVKFFDANNEEITSASQTVEYGGKITNVPENPTKDPDDNYSYTFKGWTTTPDAAAFALVDFNTYTVDSLDVKFYPVFEATDRTYTITYVIDGVENTITKKNGEAIEAPADPAKAHYNFDGWYVGSEKYTFPAEMSPSEDGKRVKAWFIPIDYTVTLDPGEDGEIDEAQKSFTYNVEVDNIVYPDPTVKTPGKKFVKWQKDGADFEYVKGETTGNITLTAVYDFEIYTVTFADGETPSFNKKYDEKITVPAYAGTLEAWQEFKGWKSGDTTVQPGDEYSVKGDAAFTAVIENKKFTITFNKEDGSLLETKEYTYGEEITLPSVPGKEGYDFDAWYYTDGEGEHKFEYTTTTYGNYTLTPKYTPKKYTVKVTGDTAKVNITSTPVLGDLDYDTGVTMTVKVKDDVDAKSLTVTLNGVAQTLDENGSFTFTVKGETTVNVTVALNEYTVKFMDGESVVNAVTGVKDGQVAVPTAPTKEHYTFDGWYDAEEGGTKLESAGIVITGDATYYARYTAIEYKITYVIDGGTPAEFKGIFGSPVTAPETTKEGYTFDGWYTAADYTGEKVTFPTAMPDTNPTYYGRFVINTYKVTVNGAENATVTAKLKGTDTDVNLDAVPHGSEITITVTANATYKVTDIKVDGVSKTSPFDLTVTDNVTVDVTVAKKWVRVNIHNDNGYTIAVKNGEVAVKDGDSVEVGTTLTVILTLDKAYNKSDAEIDTSSDCEVTGVSRIGDVITGTIVAPDSNDVLILANRVSLNTYTVTATGDNVTIEGVEAEYDHGAEAVLTITPAEHYEITKITVNDEEKTLVDDKLTFAVTADTTVVVTTAKKMYDFSINYINKATNAWSRIGMPYESGSEVTLNNGPALSVSERVPNGYRIVGFYTTKTYDDGTEFTFPATITSNIELWVKYEPITYKITLDAGENGTLSDTEVNYNVDNDSVELPNPTANAGWVFDGWYNGDEKFAYVKGTTTGNLALTAKYSVKTHSIELVNSDHITLKAYARNDDETKGEEIADLTSIPYGTKFYVEATVSEGYEVDKITVTFVGGEGTRDLDAGANGLYAFAVEKDLKITVTEKAAASEINFTPIEKESEDENANIKYTLTVKNGGNDVNPGDKVKIGDTIVITVKLGEAYSNSEFILDVNGNKVYMAAATENEDGSYSFVINVTADGMTFKVENLTINTYSVTYTGIKDADGTAATDVVKYENAYGTPLARVKIADPANYTVNGKTYTFDKWMPDFDETAPITSNMTFTATYKLASANVSIVYTTVRAADINETTYTAPEGLAVRMDAKAKIFKDGVEVEGVTVAETGSRVTVSADLAAGEYTVVVKKQRYLESTLAITVAEDGTVTAGGDEIAEIALVPGDIVGNGSVEGDGKIDITDFIVGIRGFDPEASVTAQAADIDEDGKVTIEDLGYIKTHYGKTK